MREVSRVRHRMTEAGMTGGASLLHRYTVYLTVRSAWIHKCDDLTHILDANDAVQQEN
jgi:hypothetical protein